MEAGTAGRALAARERALAKRIVVFKHQLLYGLQGLEPRAFLDLGLGPFGIHLDQVNRAVLRAALDNVVESGTLRGVNSPLQVFAGAL